MLQYSMNFSREKSLSFLRSAAQALQDENARLRAEIDAILAAKDELEARVEEREARLSEMATANAQQQAERQRLEQEIRLLKEQLDRRTKALYGCKSERRPVEDVEETVAETSPEKKPPRKPRKGHGPTPQPKLPRVQVVNTLIGEALACKHCGGTLQPLGHEAEVAELIALEQRRIVLEQHLNTKYQCPCCHTGVTTAPGPVKLIAGGRYSLGFAVEVALQKYLGHMPLDRQAQMMRHEGLQVTTATLFDQVDALVRTRRSTYGGLSRPSVRWSVFEGRDYRSSDGPASA